VLICYLQIAVNSTWVFARGFPFLGLLDEGIGSLCGLGGHLMVILILKQLEFVWDVFFADTEGILPHSCILEMNKTFIDILLFLQKMCFM
jgi:hypothetical protein